MKFEQSETYHIDLFTPRKPQTPDYGIDWEGVRTPYGNLQTNLADRLIGDLIGELQHSGKIPKYDMSYIKDLKPSLEYNIQKDNLGFSAGLNVPSQSGMMDWLIKLSLGF